MFGFIGALVCGMSASADLWVDNTYIGLDLQKLNSYFKTHNGVPYKNIYHKSNTGLNGYVGYRLSDMLSVEGGYFSTGGRNRTVNTTTNTGVSITGTTTAKISQWFLDAVGHYRLIDELSVVGSFGLDRTKLHTTNVLTTTAIVLGNENSTGIRLGMGFEYALTHNLGSRVLFRYSSSDFHEEAKFLLNTSVGLYYQF